MLILEGLFAWYSAQEAIPYITPTGERLVADITLIDQGWKEESWNIQPVQHFDGRRNHTGHLNYAKHLLSETWETRHKPGFGGARTGWWKSPKPNHFFDATYQAICARSMRRISILSPASSVAPPIDQCIHDDCHGPMDDRRDRRW